MTPSSILSFRSFLFFFLLAVLAALALASPHRGMTDENGLVAVGIAFHDADFKGQAFELLKKADGGAKCLPILANPYKQPGETKRELIGSFHVGSVQICKPETCTLFASPDCGATQPPTSMLGIQSINFKGPIDADLIHLEKLPEFASYMCGSATPGTDVAGDESGDVDVSPVPSAGIGPSANYCVPAQKCYEKCRLCEICGNRPQIFCCRHTC